jgi:hypothetical protein
VTSNQPSSGGGGGIFGGARSREEILASKGIDLKKQEEALEKKAAVVKLTKDQEEEAEACRSELAYAEKELREANEKEVRRRSVASIIVLKTNNSNSVAFAAPFHHFTPPTLL